MPATDAISAKEWQLLAFFEVEPTRLDADIAGPYNDFTYRRVLGDVTVTFGVAPAYKDFTLTVERGARRKSNYRRCRCSTSVTTKIAERNGWKSC